MKTANNCYECEDYHNTFDKNNQIACSGICTRVDDYAFYVSKNRTVCIYTNHGRKLSLEEIKIRDEKEMKDHIHFMKHLDLASKIVAGWPEWKRRAGVSLFKNR